MTTSELLSVAWQTDLFVVGLCALALGAYAAAYRRQITAKTGLFVAAIAILFLSLASPIGVLSRGYLFSAHMLQHLLLVLVVPSLALAGLPTWDSNAPALDHRLARSLVPWGLGVGAMWLWHAPTLCDAASRSLAVGRAQTLSLILMGSAFWWPIFGPARARRLPPFAAMLYLFTACVACTLLGVIVTFSPVEVCSVFAHPVDRLGAISLLRDGWGLTPHVDQEIGGLLMWVPACMVYAGTILAMLGRYYREEPAEAARETAPEASEEPT